MQHAMSCAKEDWSVDIPVLEYVEHFVHHVSRSVLFHVPMDHARQNETEPCVKRSVVKP